MLKTLQVKNVAIIPEVKVQFEPGLNVLTGETGAGKSIVVDSISLLTGSRASSEVVRSGETMAMVEGFLELPKNSPIFQKLDELGIPKQGEEIIIRRTVSVDGRSRAFVNDTSTTVGVLAELAPYWVDISGQNSNQLLLTEEFHLDLIDAFAQTENLLSKYSTTYETVRALHQDLESLNSKREEALKQKEFLIFQFKELDQLKLKTGEFEELEAKHQRLANLHQLSSLSQETETSLEGEGGACESLGRAISNLQKLAKLDNSSISFVDRAQNSFSLLQELSSDISRYGGALEKIEDIDVINERLSKLQAVTRKYGSVDKAIEEQNRIAGLLSLVEDSKIDEKELQNKLDSESRILHEFAEALNKKRKLASKKFTKEVSDELKHLGMAKAELDVKWSTPTGESVLKVLGKTFCPKGVEIAQILFAPNPGEGFSPLHKIASGGELSRVLLGIKSVALSTSNESGVAYLFDEIDSGIGGETAERVGIRMRTLAEGRQVLCVTHLAQIAVYATSHFHVEKIAKSGRTVAQVVVLLGGDRTKELSRMIGGIQITAKTIDYASELLERAHVKKLKRVLT